MPLLACLKTDARSQVSLVVKEPEPTAARAAGVEGVAGSSEDGPGADILSNLVSNHMLK